MVGVKSNVGLLSLVALAYTFLGAHSHTIHATSGTSLVLKDTRTKLDVHTLFVDLPADVVVDGLLWKELLIPTAGDERTILNYRTLLNGDEVYVSNLTLPRNPAQWPSQIAAGTISAKRNGKMHVEVEFWTGGSTNSVSTEIQAFRNWMACIPLIIILILGFFRSVHVIYALMIGLFVGSCLVAGSVIEGFQYTITKYIVMTVSNPQHIYIYSFALMAAGVMAMIRRSGGISAVAQRVSRLSGSIIIGQILVLGAGVVLFFDPYASIIFLGEAVSPYFRLFPVSLEKYAFLIQSTGFPVASISPLSTIVGFSSSVIQTQLDQLQKSGFEDLTVPTDGWSVFMLSIKYQFYPIFLLVFVALMVASRRDLGPMLIAERNRWLLALAGEIPKWTLREKIARPERYTPRRLYNMWIPTMFWITALCVAFCITFDPESETASEDFMAAIICCTIGVAAAAQVFYMVQYMHVSKEGLPTEDQKEEEHVEVADVNGAKSTEFILKSLASREDSRTSVNEETIQLPFVSVQEGAHCFLNGGATVAPVLITLTLAWATTEVFLDLGIDRLFANLIGQGGVQTEMYPTLGFMVSLVLALATGSSAAAQAIVLPLFAIPVYVESNGNAELFYALIGGVFSGSVVGDHSSPISASSILSSVAIECDLRDHLLTQAPYVLFVAVMSVLVGHLPSAFANFPYYVSYIIGLGLSILFFYFLCEEIAHEGGKFDLITEWCFVKRSPYLQELQAAIIAENEEIAAMDTDSGSMADFKDGSVEVEPREPNGSSGPSDSSVSFVSSRSESYRPNPRYQRIVVDKPRSSSRIRTETDQSV